MSNVTLYEVATLFEAAEQLPTKPDYKKFPIYTISDVIDLDQSVRWNREEMQRRMENREKEEKRLKEVKKAAIHDAHQMALRYIVQETNLAEDKAALIWDSIVGNYSIYKTSLWNQLQSQIELYNKLK